MSKKIHTITIEIPKLVVEFCKKKKISNEKMYKLYALYINHFMNETMEMPGEDFEDWVEEEKGNFDDDIVKGNKFLENDDDE